MHPWHMQSFFCDCAACQASSPDMQLFLLRHAPFSFVRHFKYHVAFNRSLHSLTAAWLAAEGVVESGGVINKLGTYTIALAAKALNVPYYVAAESYKVGRVLSSS